MIAVIGAGLSGATIARLYADAGYKVVVYEKNDRVGGMARDGMNEAGILVPHCGPHFFHTNDEEVWKFMQRFGTWVPYENRVLALCNGTHYPIPPNDTTEELAPALSSQLLSQKSLIRRYLFEPYTRKQWGPFADEVSAEVQSRVKYREGTDDRYFTDKYQAVPAGGYTAVVEDMLAHPNITVKRERVDGGPMTVSYGRSVRTFFTGRIDHTLTLSRGNEASLDYRCLRFEHITLALDTYQQRAVINFPGPEPWTRITEPKHYAGGPKGVTTIIREYPGDEGEPCYPVPTQRNKDLYAKYQERAKEMEGEGIYFVGRLATYKYLNMDQAVREAMDFFERVEEG